MDPLSLSWENLSALSLVSFFSKRRFSQMRSFILPFLLPLVQLPLEMPTITHVGSTEVERAGDLSVSVGEREIGF